MFKKIKEAVKSEKTRDFFQKYSIASTTLCATGLAYQKLPSKYKGLACPIGIITGMAASYTIDAANKQRHEKKILEAELDELNKELIETPLDEELFEEEVA